MAKITKFDVSFIVVRWSFGVQQNSKLPKKKCTFKKLRKEIERIERAPKSYGEESEGTEIY